MAGKVRGRAKVTRGMEISGARELIKRAGASIVDARAACPVRTGKLRASLKVQNVYTAGHAGAIISMLWYGRIVESGRRARKPKRDARGRFRDRGANAAPPHPFLKPAVFRHLGARI